ncbi:MAG: glucosaminidase domain-containing protein [Candidatus Faecousia sp.]|nr:glucosaminidase domain-containing protein [Candidatus Faecousia sp.]
MPYTNSPLVDYVKISPNSTNPRNQPISVITIHHMAGNLSVESCGNVFATTERQASSNYGIGSDGRVGMYVEEANRSWCSSNRENDHKAVTIEVANDDTSSGNWHVSDAALSKLIDLCVDICQRNGIPRLNFTGDKTGNLTMHKWFTPTQCPGPYLESKFPYIAEQVNLRLTGAAIGSEEEKPTAQPYGTQGSIFLGLSTEEAVSKIGELCRADMKTSGILASVSAAQFILESGYGKSELSQKANNCFGMKASLSGNTWSNSTWDGSSVHTIPTQEQNPDGSYVAITADFRKYTCVEDSVADHSAYLLGAKKGRSKRYKGLAGCRDYRKAVQIIKDGGYATDLGYVNKLCNLIERFNLTQYDTDAVTNTTGTAPDTPAPAFPYLVKVSIPNLNIRKGPGTNYPRTGYFTGVGVFTIVEEANGEGAAKWGKLKSGMGWISLNYARKV